MHSQRQFLYKRREPNFFRGLFSKWSTLFNGQQLSFLSLSLLYLKLLPGISAYFSLRVYDRLQPDHWLQPKELSTKTTVHCCMWGGLSLATRAFISSTDLPPSL